MKYTTRSMRRRRNTDQWEVTLSHKDPATGEPVRTFHTVRGKTKRQAEKARNDLILALERKGGAVGTHLTVAEFVKMFVDAKAASGTIESSTVRDYRMQARTMARYIGDVEVADLKIADVEGWMAAMAEDGYAPKSCAKPFRLLKQALKWGVAQDYLAKNPCDFCKPPKRAKTPINALDRAERTRMLQLARAANGQPLGVAIELALTTGMRRGEVCALRWSDLGDDRTVTVRRALGRGEDGYYVKEPKTASSGRTIPLTSSTFSLLRAMRADSARTLEALGLGADPYILGTQEPDSKPYNPTQLGKDFAAFCKMNGFDCTFHDLRHTFATMMIAGGTDVRTVASYLGHSSVSMTLDIYADVDPDAKRAAVANVEGAFDADLSLPVQQTAQQLPAPQGAGLVFTAEQLRAMLAEAERREAGL
ncbi:MAG: tyrosine-type recombinase/integrase [Coriobacteriaceae bacterium]|nr:tyrosine-type recombinase/integrase [Coriobacteriaceae bacterium]